MTSAPTSLSHALGQSRTRLRIVTVAAALSAALVAAPAALASEGTAGAHSATQGQSTSQSQQTHRSRTWSERFNAKAQRVLRVTRRHKGDPYQYGAAGPHRFDCSGLVMYVFKRALGRSLPHNAEEQMQRAHRIARHNARPGDLVFQVDSGGYAFHVGIYAGHGWFWNAPHSGSRVREQKMWGGNWRYGRIIRAAS